MRRVAVTGGSVRRALTHSEIAGCFNSALGRAHRTRLIGGGCEPLYLPGGEGWSVVRFTHDYAASALHELAHWCIAGRLRRAQLDYGYWYRPPPRTKTEQAAFNRVEVSAQALESTLAAVCGLDFRVSVDDPDGCPDSAGHFAELVAAQAARPAQQLPPRAVALLSALARLRERL